MFLFFFLFGVFWCWALGRNDWPRNGRKTEGRKKEDKCNYVIFFFHSFCFFAAPHTETEALRRQSAASAVCDLYEDFFLFNSVAL